MSTAGAAAPHPWQCFGRGEPTWPRTSFGGGFGAVRGRHRLARFYLLSEFVVRSVTRTTMRCGTPGRVIELGRVRWPDAQGQARRQTDSESTEPAFRCRDPPCSSALNLAILSAVAGGVHVDEHAAMAARRPTVGEAPDLARCAAQQLRAPDVDPAPGSSPVKSAVNRCRQSKARWLSARHRTLLGADRPLRLSFGCVGRLKAHLGARRRCSGAGQAVRTVLT